MKIGQLTLPFNWNYGGLLQGYALKKTLQDLGHEVTIISRRKNRNNPLIRFVVSSKWYVLRFLSYIPVCRAIPLISVETFKHRYIKDITKNIYTDASLKECANRYGFEGYVVGSDQIWNSTAAPHINDAFLDFVSNKKDIKRVSYAASFGKGDWKYSEKATSVCKVLAQKFDAISVRENSGVTLCTNYLNVSAQHHLDPTMLLSKEDYIKIIHESKVAPSNGGLLLYILDVTEERQKIVDTISKELNLAPYGIRQFKKIKILQNALTGIYPSVQQWLKSFYDAEFVVTDSFHGTIFAIIFNKPFITVGNKERGMARFESLLKDLGLQERLINNANQINNGLIYSIINWENVNKEISFKKENSLNYLKKYLNN
jgi:hypothetical protein